MPHVGYAGQSRRQSRRNHYRGVGVDQIDALAPNDAMQAPNRRGKSVKEKPAPARVAIDDRKRWVEENLDLKFCDEPAEGPVRGEDDQWFEALAIEAGQQSSK